MLAVAVLVVTALLATGGLALRGWLDGTDRPAGKGAAAGSASGGVGGGQQEPADEVPAGGQGEEGVPQTGAGTYGYAAASTAVLGKAGTVRKFQVAVENGAGQEVAAFAAAVDDALGDPRGWTAGGDVRLQRVSKETTAELVIMLATPGTTETVCAAAGVQTRRYTSCQVPGKVVINLARWLLGVKDYGAGVDAYRPYAVNHEVGHALGFTHEACPGAGRPAPVMQQQTLGLHGCVANAWPYLDGQRYAGTKIP
jgi:hypothetical protein